MSDYIPSGATGTDGFVPVWNPNGRWAIWNINEVYFGGPGAGRYVPNVKDLVLDVDFWTWYEVLAIDPSTFVPDLKKLAAQQASGEFTKIDLLLGVGPGTQSDTYRVYLDTSVVPHALTVDQRLEVAGSMTTYCRIFKGEDLSNPANIISGMYDASGNFLGPNIPLELKAMDGNVTLKTVPTCYTSEALPDGEVVTAIFYSATGHVVSKRQLLIENTAFIRAADASVRYVIDISLKSPFLSKADPNLIQYPINVPLKSMNLIGVVHYSDGSTLEMPVDNTKFSIFGFDTFVATVIGQQFDAVLKYALSPNEACYGALNTGQKFVARTYKLQTLKADGAYTVKLFGYPMWVDGLTGYRMEWFLYNLDRTIAQRVTPYVKFEPNYPAFQPLHYGVQQSLHVAVNLKDVNPAYASYRHSQIVDVTLFGPADTAGTPFTVGFEPNQTPQYGVNDQFVFEFVNQNLKYLKVDLGIDDQTEWLRRLYLDSKPLVNPYTETHPLDPNYFAVIIGTQRVEHKLEEWQAVINAGSDLYPGASVFIEFFKRTPTNDIQLAVAGVSARQVPNIL